MKYSGQQNVKPSTINTGWKRIALDSTPSQHLHFFFDSQKIWRLDLTRAKHTGPSWVFKSQTPNIRFQSRRGHSWFVFVKLSETVVFSYLGHHGLCKTKFWELILLPVGTTDVFKKYFQQKKNCPNFVAFQWPLSTKIITWHNSLTLCNHSIASSKVAKIDLVLNVKTDCQWSRN